MYLRKQLSLNTLATLLRCRAEVDPVEPPLDRRLASRRVDSIFAYPDLLRPILVNRFAEIVVR
eukprot:4731446-Prymnesium_polylepis.1